MEKQQKNSVLLKFGVIIGIKNNLFLGIADDNTLDNCLWMKVWVREGLNVYRFHTFVARIIEQCPGHSFCCAMDNLNVHHNVMIL